MKALLSLFLCLGASSCLTTPGLEMPALANAEVTNDFHTYTIRRVGLMPFSGKDLQGAQSQAFQLSFFGEVSQSTPYEIVLLEPEDLEEIELSEPYRRGWYRPRTIIQLARRYSLDAILFGTVTRQQFFPPQELSLQVDMVASETGMVIWSSKVHLDASDPRVLDGLRLFYGHNDLGEGDDQSWQLALLSPERFSRFAAFQIASLL